MAICKNCGAEVPDSASFCSACGARIEPQTDYRQTGYEQNGYNTPPYTAPNTAGEEYTREDIENNKVVALLSYISFLFIIPLLTAKESKFARFHANQGIILFLFGLILGAVAAIPVLGWIVAVAGSVFDVVCTVLGIINAVKGEAKELPLIGKFRIL